MPTGPSQESDVPPQRSERPANHRRRRRRLVAGVGAAAFVLIGAQVVLALPPDPTFTAPSVLQINQDGMFTSTATDPDGDPITVDWDFEDDGTFDVLDDPSVLHSYSSAGTRTVRMRVTDSNGEPASGTAQVRVNAVPTASFTVDNNNPQLGQQVNFDGSASSDSDGSIATYEWDLGNGTFETGGPTAKATFTTDGSKTVRLRVTDSDQATDTTSRTVTVNAPPVARFDVSPETAQIGENVSFDGSASSDPDGGSIVAFAWDFENDGFVDATTASALHDYSTPGSKTVVLTVRDDEGATDSEVKTVTVANRAPIASITADPSRAQIGQSVTFTGTASDPDPDPDSLTFEWDLGSGSFAPPSGPTATTSYSTGGDKTVRLRVTDEYDGETIAVLPFHVNARPVAKIEFVAVNPPPMQMGELLDPGQDRKRPLIGQWIGVTSQSTDDESTNAAKNNTIPANGHVWDLDLDGTFGEAGEVGIGALRVPYDTAGLKLIRLRVTDNEGAVSEDATATFCVNTRPNASFFANPETPVIGERIVFVQTATDADSLTPCLGDTTNGQLTKFEWDLDNDGTFGEVNPALGLNELGEAGSAKFDSAGDKPIKLRVTDGGGARHVGTGSVNVAPTRPAASFESSPQFPLPGQQVTFTSTSNVSEPPGGKQIIAYEWDLDGNGSFETNDGTGSASTAYATSGTKTVRLRVTETGGGFDIARQSVIVNAPPVASFAAAPDAPVTDDDVTFASTSVDPDGPISHAWDTDNDGEFDDGNGSVAARKFAAVGSYTVRLRVSDDRGASSISEGVVNVARRPAQAVLASRVSLIASTVQIAGRTTKRGAKLSLLRVRLPVGAVIKVKCKGSKACPYKSKRIKAKRTKVRLKLFERSLPAGTKIVITTTLDGFIGKHVVFKIRKNKAPKRTDRCLQPGETRPTACPGA